MPGRSNLENSDIYLNRFQTGLYSNRSPLFTPISAMGLQMFQRQDSFIAGADMDISPRMTLIRRPGFGQYSSAALNAGDFPQKYFSFKTTSGTIFDLVETPSGIWEFTTTTVTKLFPKNTTAQGSMSKVGNWFYYCDGNNSDLQKWDGTHLWKWGINYPTVAPTIDFAAGTLTTVNGGYQYVFVYGNPVTGHVSSTSPVSGSTLNVNNQTFTLSGPASLDRQVTQVQIFRTEDGGADFYWLATIANPTSGNWTYADTTPDSGLNTDIVVYPGSYSNNPPPSGTNMACFYQGRYFLAAGQYLYFSGGPDVTYGVPEESFAPANVFTMPGTITGFANTTNGLIVYTSADAFAVTGNSTLTYGIQIYQTNFGAPNQNAIVCDGNLVNHYTNSGRLFQYSTDGSVPMTEIGWQVQANLAAFNPATVCLALHRSGTDDGLFVSNGSTQMYRYSMALNTWSCAYNVVGGCGAITSIEVTPANYQLLMGRATGTNVIMTRTPTAHNDAGSTSAM